jgi:hypothetical protein
MTDPHQARPGDAAVRLEADPDLRAAVAAEYGGGQPLDDLLASLSGQGGAGADVRDDDLGEAAFGRPAPGGDPAASAGAAEAWQRRHDDRRRDEAELLRALDAVTSGTDVAAGRRRRRRRRGAALAAGALVVVVTAVVAVVALAGRPADAPVAPTASASATDDASLVAERLAAPFFDREQVPSDVPTSRAARAFEGLDPESFRRSVTGEGDAAYVARSTSGDWCLVVAEAASEQVAWSCSTAADVLAAPIEMHVAFPGDREVEATWDLRSATVTLDDHPGDDG